MFDKSLSKSVLVIAIALVFIAVLAVLAMPKQNPPIVQPTSTPTTTPIATSISPTTNPTPTPTVSPTPTPIIDISDWKTYRNDKYGFEFKYPKDWIGGGGTEYDLSKLGDNNILKATGTVFAIGFGDKYSYSRFFSLSIMTKNIDEAINFDWTSFGKRTGEPVIIGGVTGEKLKGAFYGMQYVVKNGKTYFFNQPDAAEKTDWAKYDKVISTFKFTK